MQLSTKQLQSLHLHMHDLSESAGRQNVITSRNITHTNTIIYLFSFVGLILTSLIFYFFIELNQGIRHSIHSMKHLQKQVSELNETIGAISSSIEEMGYNIEYLSFMDESVASVAKKTKTIDQSVAILRQKTQRLSQDTSMIRQNTDYIGQRFTRINQSIFDVSNNLHETAQPIRQFLPLP